MSSKGSDIATLFQYLKLKIVIVRPWLAMTLGGSQSVLSCPNPLNTASLIVFNFSSVPLITSLNFLKSFSCSFAIRTVHGFVDDIVSKGGTASSCALDIFKAFDKVNHHALLLKLMERLVPIELLNLFESWLGNCFSYVKWKSPWSGCFNLSFGVRAARVLWLWME